MAGACREPDGKHVLEGGVSTGSRGIEATAKWPSGEGANGPRAINDGRGIWKTEYMGRPVCAAVECLPEDLLTAEERKLVGQVRRGCERDPDGLMGYELKLLGIIDRLAPEPKS